MPQQGSGPPTYWEKSQKKVQEEDADYPPGVWLMEGVLLPMQCDFKVWLVINLTSHRLCT